MTAGGNSPGRLALLLLPFAAGLLLPLLGGGGWLGPALTFFMWVALVQSWAVFSGLTGYLSLGHAVFFGLGAYVMALTWGLLPVWGSALAAGAAAACFAALMGGPCLRVRGPYFVILTFGVAEFVKFCVVAIEASLSKSGRLLFGAPSMEALYFAVLGLALAATLVAVVVSSSRFGAGLRAVREDETAAETLGVPARRLKILAFTLSAFIPGVVGAVMMLRTSYFETVAVFSPITSFTIVTIAIIGGGDDARGPLLGAAFLVFLSEALQANAPELYMIILGAALIGFVLWAPGGLTGALFARRKAR